MLKFVSFKSIRTMLSSTKNISGKSNIVKRNYDVIRPSFALRIKSFDKNPLILMIFSVTSLR